MSLIANLEKMLSAGRDDALLRFSLGEALLREGRSREAVAHLQRAVTHDPDYSAAWKILGRALTATNAVDEAEQAYERGIAAAQRRGDVQAAKEMRVFLKRLRGTSEP